MAVSNGKFTISDSNAETTSELFSQIAGLVKVGKRSDGRYYLSDICIGEDVNKWAKYKPIRSITEVNLSEEERAQQFYGFDISTVFCNNCEDTLNAALANGADYPYLKPRGGAISPVEWFRLRDFDGYNSNAEVPYKYTAPNYPQHSSKWVDVYRNPKGEIKLSDIAPTEIGGSETSGDIKDYRIALVYRRRGTTVIGGLISDYTIANVDDGDQPIIRFDLTTGGTYDMVLAVTNAAYLDQEDTEWLYLPEAVFAMTYNPSSTSFIFGFAEDNGLVGVTSAGNPIYNLTSVVRHVRIDLGMQPSEDIEGKLEISFGSVEDSEIYADYTYTKEFSASAGEYYNFYYLKSNISFADPYIDKIYVQGILTYKKAGTETTYTRYIDFVSGDDPDNLTLSASKVDFVTLNDIMQKWQW